MGVGGPIDGLNLVININDANDENGEAVIMWPESGAWNEKFTLEVESLAVLESVPEILDLPPPSQ